MATSMKYLSVNGRNGKTTANKIPVIAKCLALSSVMCANFEEKEDKNLNSVFFAELIFIKNLPKIHKPTSKKTIPHWGVINKPSPFDTVRSPTIGPNNAKAIKPVNKLSLKDLIISCFSIRLSQYLVCQENLWGKKLKQQLKHWMLQHLCIRSKHIPTT